MFERVFGWGRRLALKGAVRGGDKTRMELPSVQSSPERLERYSVLAAEGEELFRAGELMAALERFGAAAALRPDSAAAHLNLGRAFLAVDRYEAARRALSVASDRAEKESPLRARELTVAIQQARKALPLSPPIRGDFQKGQTLYSGLTGNRWTVLPIPSPSGDLDRKGGGFGAVYKVRDQSDLQVYALKTFHADLIWSDEDRRRFLREAAYCMRLRPHPNIVTAEWVEVIEEFPCIVQEFVEGGDLGGVLRTQKLALPRVLELMMQCCDAMLFAYESIRLVHRDLKPSNCLLSSHGSLKVADFGIARCVSETVSSLLGLDALHNSVRFAYTNPLGTDAYMAPEQDDWLAEPDTRTDIHAFGVMLFELVTGEKREERRNEGGTAHSFVLSKMRAFDLPRTFWELTLDCVQPDKTNRPSSFRDVRARLEALYRNEARREPPKPVAVPRVDAGYWQNRAVAFQVLDLFDDALRCCDEALKLEPRNGDLWQNRGAILHRMDRHEEARESLEKAISWGVEDSDVANNLGLVLRALRRNDEALVRFEAAAVLAPADPRIAKNRAELLLSLGRNDEALQVMDALPPDAEREPSFEEARLFVLIALQRFEEARQAAERLSNLSPDAKRTAPRRFGVWKALAICYEQAGDRVNALDACRRAIEINPESEEMRQMRDRLSPSNNAV